MEVKLYDHEGIDLYIGLNKKEIEELLNDEWLVSDQKPFVKIKRDNTCHINGKVLNPYPNWKFLVCISDSIIEEIQRLEPVENIRSEENSLEYRCFGSEKIYLYHRKGAE